MKENFSINMLLFCKSSSTIYCVFFIRNIEQKDFFSSLGDAGMVDVDYGAKVTNVELEA